jgi:hypothetical protein
VHCQAAGRAWRIFICGRSSRQIIPHDARDLKPEALTMICRCRGPFYAASGFARVMLARCLAGEVRYELDE